MAQQQPPTDMTQEQAQAEAIRRWGLSATATYRPSRRTDGGHGRLARYRCTVGSGRGGGYLVEGQGNTWREAFADAALAQELERRSS
ncbi:MAG TPA: hypothetical protein VFL36_03830 [Myxococcales bacterium]|nr:hypothetical protein [Myxococcales bacterium]